MFVGSSGMLGNRDVLVAAACLDGESPNVVSVELGKWDVCDVELVCRGKFGGLSSWIGAWLFRRWCARLCKYSKAV